MTFEEKKLALLDSFHEREDPQWLQSSTFFLTMHGSHAYGLNIESSDCDFAGICIPPKEYFHGFVNVFEQAQFSKPDGQIYNIMKFFKLAADNNPNVMELLFIDPMFWLRALHPLDALIHNRHLFLSTKCKHTYSGYATAQLKRIMTHKRWLLNPPTHKPTREEFGLPPVRILTADQQGALNAMQENGVVYKLDDNFIDLLQRENAHTKAVNEYKQYEIWKNTRNKTRANLEAKFGYDTKHAMHLVRLMRQCREILTTGDLKVLRPDREELLSIRYGAWSYDKLMEWSENEDKELDILEQTSKLPKTPDRNKLNVLCINVIEEALSHGIK